RISKCRRRGCGGRGRGIAACLIVVLSAECRVPSKIISLGTRHSALGTYNSPAMLRLGEVAAADLASRYGTPLYVYDAAIIRRQIERVKHAFATLPFQPFYAMKANGSLAILELIRKNSFGCDCVSPGEIFLARNAGFTAEEIWFTCSNVSDDDLRATADPRIVMTVNSLS